MFEFLVDHAYGDFLDATSKRGVSGRSGFGKIRIGEKFTIARRYGEKEEIKREWKIELIVTMIYYYGEERGWIGDGQTGYIELIGDGDIRQGDVLVKVE